MRRTTIALPVLLFGIQAHAGIITQTVNFSIQAHGSLVFPYNQLDPSHLPLNAWAITVNLNSGAGPQWQLLNPTSNTISFNATLHGSINTDAGPTAIVNTVMPLTLGPGQSTLVYVHNPFSSFPSPAYQISAVDPATGNVSLVGTGQVQPFDIVTQNGGFVFNEFVTANNGISVSVIHLGMDAALSGTETVAYFYGDTPFIPEPASIITLSLGLAAVTACVWRQRIRVRCPS
jgi:hypothetical protein